MTESSRCLRYEDYTVGWIAALPVELAAASKMLDEEHHPLPQDHTDTIVYILGKVGHHNVVMACLPLGKTGTNSAATVATSLISRFHCIRFCFMVGIGGGVPTDRDVRLGDIVVSKPYLDLGGVVQYDFGKRTTSGFERTGFLNSPPDILLSALSAYQARNLDLGGKSSSAHVFKPKLTSRLIPQAPTSDLLFCSDYEHSGGDSCDACDLAQLQERSNRENKEIMVHYGTIASGNQVIKNGVERDLLSKQLGGILCFEMEAAGIMNTFPCLVIRGICDYADSHKNKNWQSFAAVAAAAYVKELLDIVPPIYSVNHAQLVKSSGFTKRSSHAWQSSGRRSRDEDSSRARGAFIEYETLASLHISDYDPLRTHWEFTYLRCPGTTQWIFEHQQYLSWSQEDTGKCLWLTGKIGSGKTIITSTVVERLMEKCKENNEVVLHFFYRHSHKDTLTAAAIINSYIKQLLYHVDALEITYPPDVEANLRRFFGRRAIPLNFDEVTDKVFIPMVLHLQYVILVIDGLDECDNKEVWKVLKVVRSILAKSKSRAFISGRESLDIKTSVPDTITIDISDTEISSDISEYIDWKVKEKMQEREITQDQEVIEKMIMRLSERADQMILWVTLQIDNIWEDCSSGAEIVTALENLPKDLDETYSRCVKKILTQSGPYFGADATKILPWIIQAVRPLTMIQLQQALAMNSTTGVIQYDQIPSEQDILRSCANLIRKNQEQHIVLAHHSVRSFLGDSFTVYPILEGTLERLSGAAMVEDLLNIYEQFRVSQTLAELCIRHLTSESYSLALQPFVKGPILRLDPPVIDRITNSIPWYVRSFLPKVQSVQLNLASRVCKMSSVAQLPEFFHFAREQWPDLTRSLLPSASFYEAFCDLVLKQNLTWRLHPWLPTGQSVDSHYFGLLGWSIVHDHQAIFDIWLRDSILHSRPMRFELPFHHHDGLNAFLLAARSNARWAMHTINRYSSQSPQRQHQALIASQDSKGWNALHYTALNGNHTLFSMLARQIKVPDVPALDGLTPLIIASSKGHIDIVMISLRLPCGQSQKSRFEATLMAVLNGHTFLIRKALSPSLTGIPWDEDTLEAVIDAIRIGHPSPVFSTWQYHSYRSDWSNSARREILFAAVDANYSRLVFTMLQKLDYFSIPELVEACVRATAHDFVMSGQMLHKLGESRHKTSGLGSWILSAAVRGSHNLLMEQVLSSGLDFDTPDKPLTSTLHDVICAKNLKVIALLLKYVNVRDQLESLVYLIETNDFVTVQFLFEERPTLFPDLFDLAATRGSDLMFKAVLECMHNQDRLHEKRPGSKIPIERAIFGLDQQLAPIYRNILDQGGIRKARLLEMQDRFGCTTIFYAYTNSHWECAKRLLENGADPSLLNNEGLSAIHELATKESHLDSHLGWYGFECLFKTHHIDLDVPDRFGWTALQRATYLENKAPALALLHCGADVSKREPQQHRTSLHLAVATSSSSAIDLLSYLRSTTMVDCNALDYDGNTPLHIAVKRGKSDAVKNLMCSGADPTIANYKGESVHQIAQSLPPDSIIRRIIQYKQSVGTRNIQAETIGMPF